MRMSQRFAALVVTTVLSLSVIGIALAQGQARGPGGGRNAVLSPAWIDHLNLNADQQTKIKAAADTYRAAATQARSLTGQERRQAGQQARSAYESALTSTLNADQQKQLQALRDEAQQYRGLGSLSSQLVVLNLTDDQKSKIKEIITRHQPDMEKLRASQQGTSDRTAVRTQMRDLTQKMRGEVLAVLTPDQQKQIGPEPAARRAANGGV